MIDSPPSAMGTMAAPGWYPAPEAADMLRWWDGDEWSESEFKLAPRHVRTAAVSRIAEDCTGTALRHRTSRGGVAPRP